MHTIDPPKLPLYSKMLLQILVARFTMRDWEREGEEWKKFWHSRLALRIDDEMRRRGFLL
jgi:hypothetical protein